MTRLLPTAPPGRTTRKARGFAAEIARLRAQGYTLDAIRQALAEAGVSVSVSTVWREAGRQAARHERLSPYSVAVPSTDSAPSASPVGQTRFESSSASAIPALPARQTGKEIAEAFARSHHTNPLFSKGQQ